jgi:hypothetical protein
MVELSVTELREDQKNPHRDIRRVRQKLFIGAPDRADELEAEIDSSWIGFEPLAHSSVDGEDVERPANPVPDDDECVLDALRDARLPPWESPVTSNYPRVPHPNASSRTSLGVENRKMCMQSKADDDESTRDVQVPAEPSIAMVERLEEGEYTIPDSLLSAEIWMCYQIEDGRKVPKESRPDDGLVRNIDPTQDAGALGFTDYYSALRTVKQSKANCGGDWDEALDGVGLSLGELEDGRTLAGFDIDDAVVDRAMEEWARTLVRKVDTYTELSPSGTGLHVLFYGELSDKLRDRTAISGETEAHLEAYDSDRYFTFTGRKLADAPETVQPREGIAQALHRAWFNERDDDTASSKDHVDGTNAEPMESGLTEEDARVLAHIRACDDTFQPLWEGRISGYPSHSEADMALISKLSYHCRKNGSTDRKQVVRLFEASGLVRDKWYDRRDYRERTLNQTHYDSFD